LVDIVESGVLWDQAVVGGALCAGAGVTLARSGEGLRWFARVCGRVVSLRLFEFAVEEDGPVAAVVSSTGLSRGMK
jgi:hypothetical protein